MRIRWPGEEGCSQSATRDLILLIKSVVMGQGPMELRSSFESRVACWVGGGLGISDFDFEFLLPGPVWVGAVVVVVVEVVVLSGGEDEGGGERGGEGG